MAPDGSLETGPCAAAHVCRVFEAHARRAVPGGRLCSHVCGLLKLRRQELRGGIRALLGEVEGQLWPVKNRPTAQPNTTEGIAEDELEMNIW